MEMKRAISPLIFSLLIGCLAGHGQDSESYERFEILTASSPNHSRSTDWKPGDGVRPYKALELAGITRDTPDPPGSRFGPLAPGGFPPGIPCGDLILRAGAGGGIDPHSFPPKQACG